MPHTVRKHDFAYWVKMLSLLAVLTGILLVVLFVSAFLVPAQRNGLAIMLLPCAILLILLCLLSRRIDSSLSHQQQVYLQSRSPSNMTTASEAVIIEGDLPFKRDVRVMLPPSGVKLTTQVLQPQTPPPRYEDVEAGVDIART